MHKAPADRGGTAKIICKCYKYCQMKNYFIYGIIVTVFRLREQQIYIIFITMTENSLSMISPIKFNPSSTANIL